MNTAKMITCCFICVAFVIFVIIASNTAHVASDKALQMSCANNLRLIYNALTSYTNENEGYFPDKNTAAVLLKTGKCIDSSIFICPTRSRNKASLSEDCDYLFFTEGKKDDDFRDNDIIAIEKEPVHNECIHVIFADNTSPRLIKAQDFKFQYVSCDDKVKNNKGEQKKD